MTARHPSPLSDTGESRAVSEAMEQAREVFVTEVECEKIARAEMEKHAANCPVSRLEDKLDKFVDEFVEFRGDMVEFRGEIRGQLRLVMWGVPLLLTLGGLLVTGAWKISESTQHPRHATIQDAGLPAGTAVAYSSNK